MGVTKWDHPYRRMGVFLLIVPFSNLKPESRVERGRRCEKASGEFRLQLTKTRSHREMDLHLQKLGTCKTVCTLKVPFDSFGCGSKNRHPKWK